MNYLYKIDITSTISILILNNSCMRINKFLAQCDLGSRRKVEDFIKLGDIKVNGRTCTNLGTQITEEDIVEFNGKRIEPSNEKIYLALNKPKEYLVTKTDTHDRRTIYSLLPNKYQNLRYVGRLDYDSEGLIFMTNDGDWINEITHPKYKLPKTYEVMLNRPISDKDMEKLRTGIMIEGKKTLPAKVKSVGKNKLHITIFEGRKRQIRFMIQAVGSGTYNLKRIQIGKFRLGNLQLGNFKEIKNPKNLI
jgi:23S rRNA pseudouridine2605 synthase